MAQVKQRPWYKQWRNQWDVDITDESKKK